MIIEERFMKFFQTLRHKWQYLTKEYSDEDVQDIEHWLYGKLYILLKEFAEKEHAVPVGFDDENEWKNQLLLVSSICKEIYSYDESESPYFDKFRIDYNTDENGLVKFVISNKEAYDKHKEWVENRKYEIQYYKETVLNFLMDYGDKLYI